MKKLSALLTIPAVWWALSVPALALDAKQMTDPNHATKTPADKATGEVKTIPMHVRVDLIDPATRTFTTKRKDGVEVKNVVPSDVTVMQGSTPAKFEDIKIGDYVSGSRRKVSDSQYTVVKITKFAPDQKTPKSAGDLKPGQQ